MFIHQSTIIKQMINKNIITIIIYYSATYFQFTTNLVLYLILCNLRKTLKYNWFAVFLRWFFLVHMTLYSVWWGWNSTSPLLCRMVSIYWSKSYLWLTSATNIPLIKFSHLCIWLTSATNIPLIKFSHFCISLSSVTCVSD